MLFLILWSIAIFCQKKESTQAVSDSPTNTSFNPYDEPRSRHEMRIMFYNVENLFDTINDPVKNDEDFLPEGSNRWNSWRYHQKLKNIYKVIIAVGGWEPPDLIGFCEIENRYVLEELIRKTPLHNYDYQIIHYESPDRRGIDVALIYRPEKFQPIVHEALAVSLEQDDEFKTRDILYVSALIFDKDTLHLFVNHWPSRRGGILESEVKRLQAASVAREKINYILSLQPLANIVLMGDFNDHPDDRSLYEQLRAKKPTDPLEQGDLANLMYEAHEQHDGTHKYQGHWGVLDQIIVSTPLLQQHHSLRVKNKQAYIFKADFLLKDDERWIGKEPFRTYEGFKYTGGYSDHMPVFVDLIFSGEKK